MIVAVRFENSKNPEELSKQAYNYETSLPLSVGDKVVCPVRDSESSGVVVKINVPVTDVPEHFRHSLREIKRLHEDKPAEEE